MKSFNAAIEVKTTQREMLIDVTEASIDTVRKSAVLNGIVVLFVPHTTAAVTINENADPDVSSDIIEGLNQTFPNHSMFRHAEGNSDAHTKASVIGNSEHMMIQDGWVVLGTWQGVHFCEFDGPRARKLDMMVLGE